MSLTNDGDALVCFIVNKINRNGGLVMEVLSLHSEVDISDTESLWVIYNLVRENSLYGVESYIAGTDRGNARNYCLISNVFADQEFAEQFLHKLASGNVLPLQLQEIVEDLFPCVQSSVHSH